MLFYRLRDVLYNRMRCLMRYVRKHVHVVAWLCICMCVCVYMSVLSLLVLLSWSDIFDLSLSYHHSIFSSVLLYLILFLRLIIFYDFFASFILIHTNANWFKTIRCIPVFFHVNLCWSPFYAHSSLILNLFSFQFNFYSDGNPKFLFFTISIFNLILPYSSYFITGWNCIFTCPYSISRRSVRMV